MADVIDMFDRRRRTTEPPSVESLAEQCSEEISTNWERFARNNRLNDYFLTCVPPSWTQSNVNYLADINSISSIENKIGIAIIVNAPGTCETAKLGWVAAFEMKGVRVETPIMMCEAYARCFNIILFLKLSRAAQQHGISLEK